MRLEKTIVIFSRNGTSSQTIELVLLVTHPEGSDPVEDLYACMHDYINSRIDESAQTPNQEFTWSELIESMQGWDWSSHTLHIQEFPMWAVINRDEDLTLNANRSV